MCGLLGWVGDDPKKFNYGKFHTLGVHNESRGKHSCGASFDGEIYFGVDKKKVWRDFSPGLKQNFIDNKMENAVVIGHTRWATGGAHNMENAHPFGYGDNDGIYHMVGAHNGSLLSYEKLAEVFDIEVEVVTGYKTTGKGRKKKRTAITRKKIDSEVLLEIIYTYGHDVLETYLGAAALIWYDTTDSNVMYAYHGKSSTYKNSVNKTEERPLHYLIDGEGSLYVSSLPESLHAINDNGGEIGMFEHNTLYRIEGGDIENAEKTAIDREGCHQKEYGSSGWSGRGNSYGYQGSFYDDEDIYGGSGGSCGVGTGTGSTHSRARSTTSSPSTTAVATTTTKSTIPGKHFKLQEEKIKGKISDVDKGIIYYNRLRYWKQDKLITGIYTPLKDNNMFFLGFTPEEAQKHYKELSNARKYTETAMLFYYFRGVRLSTELDYKMATRPDAKHTFEDLSHMSKYPIVDLSNDKAKIIHFGKPADLITLPFLSRKLYTIVEGNCTEVEEYSDGIEESDFCFLLECDRVVNSVINGDLSVTDEELSEEVDDDGTILSCCCEDIESSFDDCITDIDDNVTDENVKNEAMSLFASMKLYVKEQLACLRN